MAASRLVPKRGRMHESDEKCIQINTSLIEKEVDGGDLAAHLFAAQVIDGDDKDDIMAKNVKLARTRRLIEILLQRGPHAFDQFIESLEKTGYHGVVSKLRETMSDVGIKNVNKRVEEIAIWWRDLTRKNTLAGESQMSASGISSEDLSFSKRTILELKDEILKLIKPLATENQHKTEVNLLQSLRIAEQKDELVRARKKIIFLEERISDVEKQRDQAEAKSKELQKKVDAQGHDIAELKKKDKERDKKDKEKEEREAIMNKKIESLTNDKEVTKSANGRNSGRNGKRSTHLSPRVINVHFNDRPKKL